MHRLRAAYVPRRGLRESARSHGTVPEQSRVSARLQPRCFRFPNCVRASAGGDLRRGFAAVQELYRSGASAYSLRVSFASCLLFCRARARDPKDASNANSRFPPVCFPAGMELMTLQQPVKPIARHQGMTFGTTSWRIQRDRLR